MYLHIGNNVMLPEKHIIGVFDLEITSQSKRTSEFLRQAEEEILQRALSRLTARRGSFPFLPEFGSRLCLLGAVAPLARETAAERYVTEALAPETALKVESVRLREEELVMYLRCMGEERKLRLPLGEATA